MLAGSLVVHVRAATMDDAEDLVQACMALAMESEGRAPDEGTVRAGLARALAERTADYFVAEDEGFAGSLFVTREWSDWNGGWYWWIQGVYVLPSFRGTGVYRALYDAVHAAACKAGDVKSIRLYVHDTNASARAVYAAMGMKEEAYRIFDAPVQTT